MLLIVAYFTAGVKSGGLQMWGGLTADASGLYFYV